jgi:AraC family transcriptional regulator
VERLRVERAALLLGVQDRTVLDIALETGFQGPEVFSRAFRRRMGTTPSAYRDRWRSLAERHPRTVPGAEEHASSYELSETRLRRLRAMWLAFVRHTGPYEAVPVSLFNDVADFVRRTGRSEAFLLVAVAHDAPSVTGPDRLRFDACVRVPAPFRSEGSFGCQELPARTYAVTTFVGPFDKLGEAYGVAAARTLRMAEVVSIGLPAVELFHQTRLATGGALHSIDICLGAETRSAVEAEHPTGPPPVSNQH